MKIPYNIKNALLKELQRTSILQHGILLNEHTVHIESTWKVHQKSWTSCVCSRKVVCQLICDHHNRLRKIKSSYIFVIPALLTAVEIALTAVKIEFKRWVRSPDAVGYNLCSCKMNLFKVIQLVSIDPAILIYYFSLY